MAVKIPDPFDYKLVWLDPLETQVRDDLNINIENWVKFRLSVGIATNSEALKSQLPISSEVKSSYLEIGKSHYESVTMLGAAKMSLNILLDVIYKDPLLMKKSFKEFYMHAGSVLDNLARLIFIINIPISITLLDNYGKLKRHSIGYGGLESIYKKYTIDLKGYRNIVHSKIINEIKIIRNNFTHGWPPAILPCKDNIEYCWPTAMRKKEQYYLWPHDPNEIKRIKREFRSKVPLTKMVNDDWIALEEFQNIVFNKLTQDIRKFERSHSIRIT